MKNNTPRLNKQVFNLDIWMKMGKNYIEQKRYDLAIEKFKKIIAIDPNNGEAHFELGKVYYMQRQYDFAIDALEKAKKMNPQSEDICLFLAKIYKATRKFDLALMEIKRILSTQSLTPEARAESKDIYLEYIDEIKTYNFQGEHEKALIKAAEIDGFIPKEDIFSLNKLLNEQEIAQKKILLNSKPRNLIVTLTKKCNLNCKMCFEDRSNWELPRKTLSEVISLFPYLERIVWQGGEVFLLDYFSELVKEASRFPNLRQVITTNGLLIDEDWAERLLKNNVDLTFSIDSLAKDVYEKIRKGGKFEVLIKNLDYFTEARRKAQSNINTNLHVVVMKSNYHQLEEFVDFARKYEFKLLALLPIGGEFDSPENIFYHRDKDALKYIAEVMPVVQKKSKEYGLMLENRLPVKIDNQGITIAPDLETAGPEPKKHKLLCHLPWIQVYLEHDGTIRPDCNCMPHEIIGHISKDSLEGVWNNSKMQSYRKKIIQNRYCQICNPECIAGRVSERYLKFC